MAAFSIKIDLGAIMPEGVTMDLGVFPHLVLSVEKIVAAAHARWSELNFRFRCYRTPTTHMVGPVTPRPPTPWRKRGL
jgi:hypothetical protein